MKKIVSIVIGCIIFLLAVWLGIQVYLFYSPVITIKRAIGQAENFYVEQPLIFIEKESVFGTASSKTEQFREFTEQIAEFQVKLGTEYTKPMSITYTVNVEEGKMTVTFQGEATGPEGNIGKINETMVFDFVLSKSNIE